MLISTSWLADHLEDPDLAVVDLRWREDGSGRDRFFSGHIPGAVFLDWTTDLVDPYGDFAFMLAPPERLGAVLGERGIGSDTTVVAYADQHGSGPFRLWWACRVYGRPDQVRVLDGGMDKWLAEGRALATAERPRLATTWSPGPGADGRSLVAGPDLVLAAEGDTTTVVVDTRPRRQFVGREVWFETGPVAADDDGIAHTPRGDLRAGRVPWAVSVPASSLYREDFTVKSPSELRALLREAGVPPEATRAVTYCGVGISAAAGAYALLRAGFDRVALYDASWDEWGRDPRRPVARD